MKRTIFAGAALMFLAAGGSAMAQKHGGDQGNKHDRGGQGERSQGNKQERMQVRAAVQQQQQQRVARHEQERAIRSNERVNQRVYAVQQQRAQLERQRADQYRAQQLNSARVLAERQRLHQERVVLEQQRLQAARNSRVAYVNTAPRYRYIVSGRPRMTTQYGADALRQAVNYGYREGYRTGRSDRVNGYAANYANSALYRNASYGYSGNYVDRSDYNYYFREGFQRGYDDGYYSRSQYGTAYNGTGSILGTVLSSLLGFQAIR